MGEIDFFGISARRKLSRALPLFVKFRTNWILFNVGEKRST